MNIKYRVELPKLLQHLNLPMVAIELGCAEGLSAKDFLDAGIEKLYMVDTWAKIPGQQGDGGFNQGWHDKNYAEAMERLKPYEDRILVKRGYTFSMAREIPDNIAGLVYIDADHSFAAVWQDIQNYWSKLVAGGVMAFHDYEHPEYGVKEAVQEFARINSLEIHLIPELKSEDAGAYFIKPLN